MDSDKDKVVEICNILIGTINRMPTEKRVPKFENDIFNPPLVERKKLITKLKYFMKKYDISNQQLRELTK